MAKITEEMMDVIKRNRGFAVATATKDGIPNVVPIHFTDIISDDEIMLVNIFMKKTAENIKNNPIVAISVWDKQAKSKKGYQFKGEARIETSGELYEKGVKIVHERKPEITPRAVVIIKVNSIFIITPGPDAGKEVI